MVDSRLAHLEGPVTVASAWPPPGELAKSEFRQLGNDFVT
jgi:hypothetical protein